MKIGITGTRSGCSKYQKQQFINFIENNKIDELHHGDCIGVDVEIANIATLNKITTICHPPKNNKLRAFHNSTLFKSP